jgi:hypothetical protein
MATAQKRAQPKYIATGSGNVNIAAHPCMISGAYLFSRTTSTIAKFYDATASESLSDANMRLQMHCQGSASESLEFQLQFNTGLHVSCHGGANAAVTIGFIGKT